MDLADTSEPSTSFELTPYKPSSKCQICNRPAHGYHHGALTCRACCAFFRRSTTIYHQWKCTKSNRCEITGSGFACKKCRMEKCLKNGMTAENFQLDRDAVSSSEHIKLIMKKELPMSLEKFIGRPHIIIRCEPKSSSIKKTFLDVSNLIDKGSKILSKDPVNYPGSSIEKLAVHMREMQKVNMHGNKVYQKISKKISLMFWEMDFCRAAEWLSHFDEFQKLPISLKMEFLKSIWYIWTAVERLAFTARKLSKNEIPNTSVALDNNTSIDVQTLEYDLSWCTHYEPDKIRFFTDLRQDMLHLKRIADILMDLQPTDVEINFMILQICFRYAGRSHQGQLLETSEKLLETVSNQMHDYYSKVLRMPNYAVRISRLMKCDRIIQEFIIVRKQKNEIAEIFDIFNLRYSHPEMFPFYVY